MRRRDLIVGCTLPLMSATPFAVRAQTSQAIRLVVPFPPGGATDITARAVGEQLARELGQLVIVENKAGAGGSIGMAEVARAAPDGLTLGVATLSTHGVNPAVYRRLPYDAEKSFVPVAELVKAPGVLVVNPQLGVKDMPAFLKRLRENPGKLVYASPGIGTIGHMWAEIFKSSTQTFMVHIPYRGAAPAVTDLIGGTVNAYFDQVASALSHVKSGRLVPLAVSWPRRLAVLPDVPTFAEVGLAGNNLPSWFGLVAPAGTPDAVVARLHVGVQRALRASGMQERLAGQGLYPSDLQTPKEFGLQIRKEIERMREAARFAKIELD
jgi:tripartite-type tricarboxylate transporter receptor subunit TctC